MKKLRMIVTSVVVLAIVGSAFAFHARVGRFCILDNSTSGTNCTTYTTADKKTTTGVATTFKYYPSFDGDATACTAASNGLCTATVKLIVD